MTCEQIEHWRGVQRNRWVSEERRCETLRERVYRLVESGEAAIGLPGGVGSLSEIPLTWAMLQTREIAPRPLVVVGEMCHRTLMAFLGAADGYLRPDHEDLLEFAQDVSPAVQHVVLRLGGDPLGH